MAAIEVGASYRSSITVTDISGSPVDPASITLTVTLPDGTTVTPSITHTGTGLYYSNYTFVQEGLHKFQWVTTSPVITETDYQNVTVFRSIVSLDDVKSYINFDSSANEDILRQMMAAVTELIENVVGNCVVQTFTDERIVGRQATVLKMPHSPLPDEDAITSISSMWPGGPVWTNSNNDFMVFPDSGTVQLVSYMPFYYGPWKATYKAGRKIIPQKIQLAAYESIYDLWSTQRPYGMDQLEPGPEETARWEMMINQYKLPPHAMALLDGDAQPGFR